jgi:hypothetical protein
VPAKQSVAQVPPTADALPSPQAAQSAPSAEDSPAGQSVHADPAVDVLPAGHFVHAPPAPSDVSFAEQFTQFLMAVSVPFTVPAGQFVSHVPPAIDALPSPQAAHAPPAPSEVSPIAQSVHAPPAVDVLPAGHFVHAPPAPSDVSFVEQSAHAVPAAVFDLPTGHLVHIIDFTVACSDPIGHLVHSVASVVVENSCTGQSVQVPALSYCPTSHAFKFLLINIINKYARFVFIFNKMNFIYLLTY